MTSQSSKTIERPNRVLGILAAVLVAWALLVPLPFFVITADHLLWDPPRLQAQPFAVSFGAIVLWIFAMAIGGLPLSLIFCFFGGYPAWLIATHLGMKRRRDAMIVGALLGLVLAGLLALLRIGLGLGGPPSGHDPWTRIVVLYPGVVLYVIATGICAGLAAWWAAGKKSDSRQEMARVFA